MISPKPILTRMILLGLVLGRMAPVRAYDPEDEVNRRARRGEAIGLSTVSWPSNRSRSPCRIASATTISV